MVELEPYYNWRTFYTAETDNRSPFYRRKYSEIFLEKTIYNTYINPQWDEFGSLTLYMKILYTNYELGFTIWEFMGEWNDILYNDIMYLYRNVVEGMIENGIQKFILIGENVLNFHADDDSYYQEWADNIEDGWIVGLNFLEHNLQEIKSARLDYYISFGGDFDSYDWRTYNPVKLFEKIEKQMRYRLGE
ncbi:MAG TPA: hypothetical protein DCG69_02725 [Bacteroidales bacterium]|nr:hypothetical protein [Bacteroidales bacterium]